MGRFGFWQSYGYDWSVCLCEIHCANECCVVGWEVLGEWHGALLASHEAPEVPASTLLGARRRREPGGVAVSRRAARLGLERSSSESETSTHHLRRRGGHGRREAIHHGF